MSKHTILITGGAGFIGSQTAKKLAERGDEVIILDDFNDGLYPSKLKHDRVESLLKPHKIPVYTADLRDYESLKKIFTEHDITKICHLGAWAGVRTSLTRPEIYEAVNITGTRHIFDLALKHNIPHVVYASSSSVYGANTKQPFSEKDRVDQPVAPYAMSKRVNELQAFYHHHLYQLKSTGLRFFTVYGPWGRPDMALFSFTQKILNDEPIQLNNFGNMKRDFTYVDDIIDGVIAALDKEFDYEIFNLGGNDTVTLDRFVSIIEEAIGKKAKREPRPMQPGEVVETVADVSKAKKLLKFNPKVHVEEGIPKFWEWYKSYYEIKR